MSGARPASAEAFPDSLFSARPIGAAIARPSSGRWGRGCSGGSSSPSRQTLRSSFWSSAPLCFSCLEGSRTGGRRGHPSGRVLSSTACSPRSAGAGTGGRCEIRTHGAVAGTPDFKSGALDRSANLPELRSILNEPNMARYYEPGRPGSARAPGEHPAGAPV
jgi:hypothetical protein